MADSLIVPVATGIVVVACLIVYAAIAARSKVLRTLAMAGTVVILASGAGAVIFETIHATRSHPAVHSAARGHKRQESQKDGHGLSDTHPPHAPTSSTSPVSQASASTVPAGAPVDLSMPAIGVASKLGPPRGLTPQGTITDAPLSGPTWSLPWWYDRGVQPGAPGSAVILGHIDSAAGGEGVFYHLATSRPGDQITLTLADGQVSQWRVTTTHLYSDSDFPDKMVYSPSGPPTLRLVSCGGAFDYTTHEYVSAWVITAKPVG